jgi:hypothetical protein
MVCLIPVCGYGTIAIHIYVVTSCANKSAMHMFSHGEKAGSANKATHVGLG